VRREASQETWRREVRATCHLSGCSASLLFAAQRTCTSYTPKNYADDFLSPSMPFLMAVASSSHLTFTACHLAMIDRCEYSIPLPLSGPSTGYVPPHRRAILLEGRQDEARHRFPQEPFLPRRAIDRGSSSVHSGEVSRSALHLVVR